MSAFNTWRKWLPPVRLRYGRETFAVPLSEAQQRESGLRDGAVVDRASASASGLALQVAAPKGVLRYEPIDWPEWYPVNGREAEGEEALKLLAEFSGWRLDRLAQEAADAIEGDRFTFAELREKCPEVFDHPLIQRSLSAQFKVEGIREQKRKPRNAMRDEDRLKIYELCTLVDILARTEGASVTAACGMAIARNPNWPETWTGKGDPADNLRKAYQNNYLPLFRSLKE